MIKHSWSISSIIDYISVFCDVRCENRQSQKAFIIKCKKKLYFEFSRTYFSSNELTSMENGMGGLADSVQDINELRIRRLQKKLEEKIIENRELKEMCSIDNQIIYELELALKELRKELIISREYN